MNRTLFLLILLVDFCILPIRSGKCSGYYTWSGIHIKATDSLPDNQLLINGRMWQNLHYRIKGDQFLFSSAFLPGSVTVQGHTFTNQKIRYDIFDDEIQIMVQQGILQLNKEWIDSFIIQLQNKTMRFVRIPENSLREVSGYVQNVYTGKTSIYVKYQKKIDRPGIQNEVDNFYQIRRMYYVNGSNIYPFKSRHELFRIFKEDKARIKEYLKKNKIRITNNNPDSYAPVVRYRDSLNM